MLIVESTRVRKRVVGRQGSVGPALKAFPPGKNKVVVRAHLIGQSNRTHVRLVDGPGYVHDRIGIVKRRYPINGQVWSERVARIKVPILRRQLPALGKLPKDFGAPILIQAQVTRSTPCRQAA